MHRAGRRRRRSVAEKEERLDRIESRLTRFTGGLEALLSRAVALGLAGLVAVQILALIPGFRRVTNLIEAYEGIPAGEVAAWNGAGAPAAPVAPVAAPAPASITVSLEGQGSAPEAVLLVDDRPVGNFGNGRVTAELRPGQRMAVDGTRAGRTLTFRVTASKGLSSPLPGKTVVTTKNWQSLGTAR